MPITFRCVCTWHREWRETPPDPDLKPVYSKRFRVEGYNRIQQQLGWELFQAWTGPGFPRVLMIEIQQLLD